MINRPNPPSQPQFITIPAGSGRIIYEDLYNSTVYQTVEVQVEPGPAASNPSNNAVGIFDVTAGPNPNDGTTVTLPRTVMVCQMEWLDHHNQPVDIAVETTNDDLQPYQRNAGQPGGVDGFGGPPATTGFTYYQDPFRINNLMFNQAGVDGLKTITCNMIRGGIPGTQYLIQMTHNNILTK